MQYTLTIIKPDAMSKGHQESILRRINLSGFKPVAINNRTLTKEEAEQFYSIHKEKPFFNDLIEFMTSGTICVMALTKYDEAVLSFRNLIGDTDPKKSNIGTIRNLYGTDIQQNAIHGSDSEENAKKEILFFFPYLSTIF